MCKTGELISSLQTIQIPVQKSWICRRFLFIKSLVGIDSQIFSQLLGYVTFFGGIFQLFTYFLGDLLYFLGDFR